MASNLSLALMKVLLLIICLQRNIIVNGAGVNERSKQQASRNRFPGFPHILKLNPCYKDPLDCFLGMWIEDSKKGFDEVAKAAGLTKEQIEFFKHHKSILGYIRFNNQWTVVVGILGMKEVKRIPFQLGVPYDSVNIDGSPLKCQTYRLENDLHERCDSVKGPNFTMYLWKSIEKGKMISNVRVGTAKMVVVYHYNSTLSS